MHHFKYDARVKAYEHALNQVMAAWEFKDPRENTDAEKFAELLEVYDERDDVQDTISYTPWYVFEYFDAKELKQEIDGLAYEFLSFAESVGAPIRRGH